MVRMEIWFSKKVQKKRKYSDKIKIFFNFVKNANVSTRLDDRKEYNI